MEYVKTHLQLQQKAINPKYTGIGECIRYTVKNNGFLGLYRGCTAVILGSIPKTGVRFGMFNLVGTKIRDLNAKNYGIENSAPSALQNLFTGVCAGVVEATLAVTPQETLKTKLIHSNAGFVKGTMNILKKEGFFGIYQGWSATALKQASNQGLRFMAFNFYKTQVSARKQTGIGQLDKPNLTAMEALVGGMASGCFSTICNNPFDMVKTRMQALNAHLQYKNIGDCFSKILFNEGILAFWQGVGTRLLRVVPGQGIVFMSYEKISVTVEELVN